MKEFQKNLNYVNCASRNSLTILARRFADITVLFCVDVASLRINSWSHQVLACFKRQSAPTNTQHNLSFPSKHKHNQIAQSREETGQEVAQAWWAGLTVEGAGFVIVLPIKKEEEMPVEYVGWGGGDVSGGQVQFILSGLILKFHLVTEGPRVKTS